MVIRRVAIVGAGIAGLACARRLAAAGHEVKVYDKGRGVGGRAATRRVQLGQSGLRFDHGAQYFTARDSAFGAEIDRLVAAGAVGPYPNSPISITQAGQTPFPEEPRFGGTPGMSSLAKGLADGLDVETSCQVRACRRAPLGWTLVLGDGAETEPFDSVVIAVPAEQAADLLLPIAPRFAQEAQAARTSPCWAAMLVYEAPFSAEFEAIRVAGPSPLAWAAHMQGNDAAYSCWVLHAKAEWSVANIDRSPGLVADALAQAFSEFTHSDAQPLYASAHRWRYAQVQLATGIPFAWDGDLGIGVCGDWRLGPRLELAWQSGNALGSRIADGGPPPKPQPV